MKKILLFLLILTACKPIHLVIDQPTVNSRAIGWQNMYSKYDFKDSAEFQKLSKFIDGIKIGNDISGSDIVVLDSVTTDGTNIYFYSGATILTAVPGVGSAAWGFISGTLENQIDLATALGLKANTNNAGFTGTTTGITAAMTGAMSTSHAANAITGANITNWNTAYGWGDPSGLYAALVHNHVQTSIVGLPDSLLARYTKAQANTLLNLKANTTALAGYVPTTRTVNGHVLSANVSVTAADVSLGNLTNKLQVEAEDSSAVAEPGSYATGNMLEDGLAGKANTSDVAMDYLPKVNPTVSGLLTTPELIVGDPANLKITAIKLIDGKFAVFNENDTIFPLPSSTEDIDIFTIALMKEDTIDVVATKHDLDTLQVNSYVYPADHYVATWGKNANAGTFDEPWATWQYAFDNTAAGELTYIRGGTYRVTATTGNAIYVQNKAGTAGNEIKIYAYPGEEPVLNLSNITATGYIHVLKLDNIDYVHIKGLSIKNLGQVNGAYHHRALVIVNGSEHSTIENCEISYIQGYGLVIDNEYTLCNDILIENCDSHHNGDPLSTPAYNNNDGFAVFGPATEGTVITITFKGCRAYANGDDGFDTNGCQTSYITFENCWSFRNGFIPGTFTPISGLQGLGWKLGAYRTSTADRRILKGCIAFDNHYYGIGTSDGYGRTNLYNCTTYRNDYGGILHQFRGSIKNCLSYANVSTPGIIGDTIDVESNTFDSGTLLAVSSADFVSVDTTGIVVERDKDGNLPDIDFLKLHSSSDLIEAGVDVGWEFNGLRPDVGGRESHVSSNVSDIRVLAAAPMSGNVYINSGDKKLHYFEGGYWHRVAILDSIFDPLKAEYLISDRTKTMGWYISDSTATITKDGGELVASWRDYLGSGHNLLQATATNKPLWSATGIAFDGTDNFMAGTFSVASPQSVYIVFKQITPYDDYNRIFTAVAGATVGLVQLTTTPELKAISNASSAANNNLALDTYGIARIIIRGATSKFQLNATAAVTWGGTEYTWTGFYLGSTVTPDNYAKMEVAELIIRSVSDTPSDELLIYLYLKDKYGL